MVSLYALLRPYHIVCHLNSLVTGITVFFFFSEFITLSVHISKQYTNYSHNHKVIWVELEEKISDKGKPMLYPTALYITSSILVPYSMGLV